MTPLLPLPRAVLFDLDGTLADTAPDLAAAVNKMLSDRQRPEVAFERLRPMASAGARGLIGIAFELTPADEGYDALRVEFLANYAAKIAEHTRLFDGTTALLANLEAAGITWGIVTNKPELYTDALLPKIGLQHAACVVSGDTTPHAKPHPEPLFEAARRINIPAADCWYVGDDLRDIQAGKAAGMPTLAAAWGYCGSQEPLHWQADAILSHPSELIRLFSA
jgi:phosphoglycolate phosphatase